MRELEYSYSNSGWPLVGSTPATFGLSSGCPDLEKVLGQRVADTCSWQSASGGSKSAPSCNYGYFCTALPTYQTVDPEGGSCTASSSRAASSTRYAFEFVQ